MISRSETFPAKKAGSQRVEILPATKQVDDREINMPLVLNEEQKALQESALAFFREKSPIDMVRKLRDNHDATGFDRSVWKQICEMGWPATIIPEEFGGLGFGYVGLGLVLEAGGRTLAASPLFSSVALGASAILLAGSAEQKAEWLPQIASGEKIFTLALQETTIHNPRSITTSAEQTANGFRISGKKTYVTDGHIADTLIVVARTGGEANDKQGVTLFLIDAKQKGVQVHRSIMVDTRNSAVVTFDNVEASPAQVLGEIGGSYHVLHKIIDRGNIALCAEMMGSIQQAFDTTLAYIKQREQFDQPIGAFQALQHRAAQMFCEIELAKSMVLRALHAVDEDAMDMSLMASAAKVHLCDTYRLVSNEGIQMHGGMGMTDEMDIGLFIKRARVAMQTLGDENYHLQRYASLRGY
jgi:alkylation response protein AidB-like acyl-CoA dehydrogenase